MKRFATAVLIGTCLLAGVVPSAAKKKPARPIIEIFEATLGGSLGPKGVLRFEVEGFSTEEDLQELAQTSANGGKDSLQKSLDHIEKGHYTYQPFVMSAYNAGSYPIRLIRSSSDGEFRDLYMVADAADWYFAVTCCAPYERVGHGGYPYTVVHLRIHQHGKGTGEQVPFATIVFNNHGGIDVNAMGQPVPAGRIVFHSGGVDVMPAGSGNTVLTDVHAVRR